MRPASAQAPGEEDSAPLLDYALVGHYVRFALQAVARHKVLAAVLLAASLGLALASLKVLPKTWRAETKILAQKNPVLASLGSLSRVDADAPTRAAFETVLRHDSLIALIEQTSLIEQWDAKRAPFVRVVDAIFRVLYAPPTRRERMDGFVELLEKRLEVTVGDGTVTIAIEWPDAQMAQRLVETAQQNFLETRHVAEVSAISDAIAILEEHAKQAEENIRTLVENLRKVRDSAHREQAGTRGSSSPQRDGLAPPAKPSAELTQLVQTLAAKRKAIEDLGDYRRRREAELQQRLIELRAAYAPAHPLVMSAEEALASLSAGDSPQLAQLKRDEAELQGQITALGSPLPARPKRRSDDTPTVIASPSGSGLEFALRLSEDRDPSLQYGDSQLRMAGDNYRAILERLDTARIELDTARAAFKYRYSVIKPAQIPKRPIKPKSLWVLIEGLVAGTLLATGVSVARDLKRPRLRERWQIERWLGLKVLAEQKSLLSATGGPSPEFGGLWVSALQVAEWRSLVIAPLHRAAVKHDVGSALRATGELMLGKPVELTDARNAPGEKTGILIASMNARKTLGLTAVVLVPPPAEAGVALALSADAILVTLCYGVELEEARRNLDLLRPGRLIGCVVVPPTA